MSRPARSSSSSTRSSRRCRSGLPRSSASASSTTAWSSTASPSTAIAEPPRPARACALACASPACSCCSCVCVPLTSGHEVAVRPLALAAALPRLGRLDRRRARRVPAIRQRRTALLICQPCQLARHPRSSPAPPVRLRLEGRARPPASSAGSPTRTHTIYIERAAIARAPRTRPRNRRAPRPRPAAGNVPRRHDRPRHALLPFRSTLLGRSTPPPRDVDGPAGRDRLWRRCAPRSAGAQRAGQGQCPAHARPRGTLPVTIRLLEPLDRAPTARRWPMRRAMPSPQRSGFKSRRRLAYRPHMTDSQDFPDQELRLPDERL